MLFEGSQNCMLQNATIIIKKCSIFPRICPSQYPTINEISDHFGTYIHIEISAKYSAPAKNVVAKLFKYAEEETNISRN